MFLLGIPLLLLCVLSLTRAQYCPTSYFYPDSCTPNGNCLYSAAWQYETATDTVLFTVTTWRSTAVDFWVGLGFSRTPSMISSDLILSYLRANGSGLVKDFWANDGVNVVVDTRQDVSLDSQWWNPVGSVQSAFRRPLSTGDVAQDYSLASECFYFLYFINGLTLGSNDEVTLSQPTASSQKICICRNTTTPAIPPTTAPLPVTTVPIAIPTSQQNSWNLNCPTSYYYPTNCIPDGNCLYTATWQFDNSSGQSLVNFVVTTWRNTDIDYWIGIAFAPTPRMIGADIVLSYLRLNGTGLLQDFYAPNYGTPVPQSSQSSILINQWWITGKVSVTFQRPTRPASGTNANFDQYCYYFIYLVDGLSIGPNDEIYKHTRTPQISANPICICLNQSTTTPAPVTTPTPPAVCDATSMQTAITCYASLQPYIDLMTNWPTTSAMLTFSSDTIVSACLAYLNYKNCVSPYETQCSNISILQKANSVLGYICGTAAADFVQNANCLLSLQSNTDSIQLAQCNYYAFQTGVYNPQMSDYDKCQFLINALSCSNSVISTQCGSGIANDIMKFGNLLATNYRQNCQIVQCGTNYCLYGATCTNGQCVCPSACPQYQLAVCGSDGKIYPNVCWLNLASCTSSSWIIQRPMAYCNIQAQNPFCTDVVVDNMFTCASELYYKLFQTYIYLNSSIFQANTNGLNSSCSVYADYQTCIGGSPSCSFPAMDIVTQYFGYICSTNGSKDILTHNQCWTSLSADPSFKLCFQTLQNTLAALNIYQIQDLHTSYETAQFASNIYQFCTSLDLAGSCGAQRVRQLCDADSFTAFYRITDNLVNVFNLNCSASNNGSGGQVGLNQTYGCNANITADAGQLVITSAPSTTCTWIINTAVGTNVNLILVVDPSFVCPTSNPTFLNVYQGVILNNSSLLQMYCPLNQLLVSTSSRVNVMTIVYVGGVITAPQFVGYFYAGSDQCASKPCLNGGTCVKNQLGFQCVCPLGYVSTRCEKYIGRCSTGLCQNGGTCVDGYVFETSPEALQTQYQDNYVVAAKGFDFYCNCTPNYQGQFCQTATSALFCTFEGAFCNWQLESSGDFYLSLTQGTTPTAGTGPIVDHTLNSPLGTYAFEEASYPRKPGDKARLLSPTVDPTVFMTRQFCFQFWYNMYGSTMGTINIYSLLTSSSTTPTLLWTKSGQQGQYWQLAAINFTSTQPFNIRIEMVVGSGYLSDAAVDDVSISPGACISRNSTTQCPVYWRTLGNFCYFYLGDNVDYAGANQKCFDLGAEMVSVHSSTENKAIGTWLQQQQTPESWLGGQWHSATGWQWSDFTVWGDFTSWNSGEPQTPASRSCHRLSQSLSNNWRSTNCSAPLPGYFCKTPMTNQCQMNPCLNGGSCINNNNGFSCVCPAGYNGTVCDQSIDTCSSQPCQNGGVCVNIQNGFWCQCQSGFSGTVCERGSSCTGNNCKNGATCYTNSSSSGYSCACPIGFTGSYCDVVDKCAQYPPVCQNSGVCVSSTGGFNCSCPPGFSGTTCSQASNPCSNAAAVCLNGGTCVVSGTSYQCVCAAGYFGSNCNQISTSTCPSTNSCANGATCVVDSSSNVGYSCNCTSGFYGQFCQTRGTQCSASQNTCRNGATCLVSISGSTQTTQCLCTPGYYGVLCDQSGSPCSVMISQLGSNPCLNGGTCLSSTSSNGYTCVCPVNYYGAQCSQTRCSSTSSLCLNGGTCITPLSNSTLSYQCICAPGFAGINCQTSVSLCYNNPCLNGGSCLLLSNGYLCRCPTGYTGANCEVNSNLINNFCYSSPCLNGGTCLNGQTTYNCLCPTGRTGVNCQLSSGVITSTGPTAAACQPNPCQNSGVCVSLSNGGRVCVCLSTSTGTNCEISLMAASNCNPSPCAHGTCVLLTTGSLCKCQTGWTGGTCAININECDPSPCKNGATCVDGTGSYTCTCPYGYGGQNCDQLLDLCPTKPCSNGGTCVKAATNSSCLCTPEYAGVTCDFARCGQAGWSYNQGSCYQGNTTLITQTDAQVACRLRSAQLLSLFNDSELYFVGTLMAKVPLQILWTGARYSSGGWSWSDGSAMKYTKWQSNFPTDPINNPCVTLALFQGVTLSNRQCTSNQGFMCRKAALIPP